MKIYHYLLLCFVTFMAQSSWATNSIQKEKFHFRSNDQKIIEIDLISYRNHLDSLEVKIQASGLPRLNKDFNPILGYGRDTDGNNKIDAWFFITEDGIKTILAEGKHSLGKDLLSDLLKKHYHTSVSLYASTAATSVLSYLFISVNEAKKSEDIYYQNWIDLEESQILFERDLFHTRQEIMSHYELQSMGYSALAKEMDDFAKKSFWGYALADIGLWMTGGVVINWGAKLLGKIGISLSETAFIQSTKETMLNFLQKQKNTIETKISQINQKLRPESHSKKSKSDSKLSVKSPILNWSQNLSHAIKSRKTKHLLKKSLITSIKWPKKIVKGAASEWKYITMNTSVQLGAEAVARYDEIYDENPVIMANNLITNPEVIQNVGFMATDTILMTGISKNLKTTKARFMASGAVAITNSSIVNFGLSDDANIGRVAFDTAWETIIGNAQVQIDLKALEHFEKMAQKKNNPKIKLVGYAVALVDMGIGYFTYSKATSMIEESETKPETENTKEKSQNNGQEVMLIPILANAE